MTANDRTGVGSGSGAYETPDPFYVQLDRRYRFTYDPFSSHENHKTPLYSTLDGTFIEHEDGTREQINDLNGLQTNWAGQRAFCNPPYTRGLILPAVTKMAYAMARQQPDCADLVVGLLPASTDVVWFHQYVLARANVEFLKFRINFVHPPFECGPKCQTGKEPHVLSAPLRNPPGGYCIADYRTNWANPNTRAA